MPEVTSQIRKIEWVSAVYMSEKSYLVHNFFYDNSNIDTNFIKKKPQKI